MLPVPRSIEVLLGLLLLGDGGLDGLLVGGGLILMADVLVGIGKRQLFGKAREKHPRPNL